MTIIVIVRMSTGKFASDANRYLGKNSSDRRLERENEFLCQICRNQFVDPRVLPCLHCFCAECLHRLDAEQNRKPATVKQSRNERLQGILGGYFSKEKCSRGEYVRISASPEVKLSSDQSHNLKCPICGFNNTIPVKGISDLPPHYLLQHRMFVHSINNCEINLLCDLCTSETLATTRCTKCLLNLCKNCSKSHKRDNFFPDHELRKLYRKKNRGEGNPGITKIRRQVMCPSHRDKELRYYCSSCCMVACTECCIQFHTDHNYESFSRAAETYMTRIKDGLEKTRLVSRGATAAIDRLDILKHQIESKYSQVQNEINAHIDCYVEAFERHRKGLLKKAAEIKCEQMESVTKRRKEVEKKTEDIGHTLKFGEELLKEGSDFEVLSFAFFLLQRLDWCIQSGSSALSSAFASCLGTLQFLPNERAGTINDKSVFGVVTTQIVSPSHCHITPEGLDALRNCREKQRCDLILVTKDSYNQRLTHGSEGIEVSLKCQSDPNRQIPICIVDQQNGVYLISFTPDLYGKMSLSVSIRGVPIKGSPFSIIVRSQRNHTGNFHCCTFCSDGGNKNATCGCGGRTPGGYQCCDHRYKEFERSCCGKTLPKTECLRPFRTDGFYQLSL